MARKTKSEADATRTRILDAAERMFQAQGVSGTSLQAIAAEAGVTRGAVYWHFQDKSDVFNAMLDRVCMPMELTHRDSLNDAPSALGALQLLTADIFTRVACDEQVRRVFDIATHKIEYVQEHRAVRQRHLEVRKNYQASIARVLRAGQRSGEVVARPSAQQLAIGLHALVDGLVHNWMLDPAAFDLQKTGMRAIQIHLAGLSAPAPSANP